MKAYKTKTPSLLTALSLAAVLCLAGITQVRAEDKPAQQQLEYAIIKWDGPDRIQIYYPDHFEYFRVFEKGNVLPKNANEEEFCVNIAINKLAKEGWQAVTLHARRVLLQRPVSR